MNEQLMLLPCKDYTKTLLLSLPTGYEGQEAFRKVVGIIAEIESHPGAIPLEELIATLEDHGFVALPYMVGPEIAL